MSEFGLPIFFRKVIFFILALPLLQSTQGWAQQPGALQKKADTSNLRVGIAGSSPFLIKEDNENFDGIALEIWQLLELKSHWNSSFVYCALLFGLRALIKKLKLVK